MVPLIERSNPSDAESVKRRRWEFMKFFLLEYKLAQGCQHPKSLSRFANRMLASFVTIEGGDSIVELLGKIE